MDILTRRRQNNPILTGEAGVGKTAVVEGFAHARCAGRCSAVFKNVIIRTLDLALLQAGAGVKGEFENRLKGLIEEVKASPTPIILFIDEAHTMIGAGGQAGQNDAANLLKPALARGELRTIAATTWSEYKKYFEKDAGAGASLSSGESGGADRDPVHGDDARRLWLHWKSTTTCAFSTKRLLRRSAFPSLSCRTPDSRQSGQRTGYCLRAFRSGAKYHSSRDRGRRSPDR